MQIISNYNLSIYPKANKQQSKTNPNFGICTKNLVLLLAAGTTAVTAAAARKLMPVPDETALPSCNPAAGNNVSGLKNLRADRKGYTQLHLLCTYGNSGTVKKFLDENPDINLGQMTEDGKTCMLLAIENDKKDIINLIANTDNYNPVIPDKNGFTDFHRLCEKGYTDAVKTLLEKHPEFDINQQTKGGYTCMSLAIDNGQKDTVNLIAGMDNYNPTILDRNGWTDFHRLCEKGYTDVVKTLLEKYPEFDINLQDNIYRDTCMSLAVRNGHEDIINLIAGMNNYNPAITHKDDSTDFHHLCQFGYTDVVKTLLEKHPEFDINQKTKDDFTCMSLAAINRHEEIVNLIANMDNYNPAITDKIDWTALHHLCKNGYTDAVKTILKKHPDFDINQKTKDGYTCMSLAIKNSQKDVINLIANMNNYNPVITDDDGWSDLHHLCQDGYTDTVKTILEKHPEFDINQQTLGSHTCMYLAAKNKQDEIVNLIANMDKYNPTIPDEYGWTDFHRLCSEGCTDAVKTILEKHPEFDINQQTEHGNTCMSLAIKNNQKDIINLIANMDKYNPAIPNKDGWTDFHRLCHKGYTDVVKTLLKKHPEFDINQKTKYGITCMSNAIDGWHDDIINFIAGMDNYNPTIPDKNGLTDLHRLCDKGYTDAIKFILKKHPEIELKNLSKSELLTTIIHQDVRKIILERMGKTVSWTGTLKEKCTQFFDNLFG